MRTALVTGATSGIGAEAAEELGERGWRVLVHGRDGERGAETVERVERAGGEAEFLSADFADPEAVRELADEASDRGVDALVNNAGLSSEERRFTAWGDDVEATLAVNHLAPYLLTHDLLAGDGPDRVVVTASAVHYRGDLRLDDLRLDDGYDALDAYARSKLANVLFGYELAERFGGTAVAFHPGFVPGSRLYRETRWYVRLGTRLADLVPFVGTTVEAGGADLAYLTAEDDSTGAYFHGRDRKEPDDRAHDPGLRERLWSLSADLAGVDPDWP